MTEETVSLSVYESAVKGRQDFRRAFRRVHDENQKLREALEWVRNRGIIAGAAFVRGNEDSAQQCADVLNRIDAALARE